MVTLFIQCYNRLNDVALLYFNNGLHYIVKVDVNFYLSVGQIKALTKPKMGAYYYRKASFCFSYFCCWAVVGLNSIMRKKKN